MPKRFLTKRDIDEYAECGVMEVVVDDDTVLTDLARDRAMDLGVRLIRVQGTGQGAEKLERGAAQENDVRRRVRAAVIANLGGAPPGLEAIITRVLSNMNLES